MVKDAVHQCPLPLVNLDGKLREFAESFFPNSVGIEIECRPENDEYDYSEFYKIDGIIHIQGDGSEQRFRFANGVKGMVALYKASLLFKDHFLLNPQSGIHYHIDFTEHYEKLKGTYIIPARNEGNIPELNWMLKGLRNWNYKGYFNSWVVGINKNVIRLHPNYHTIEYRIGEMTFDYSLLIKRIITCQRITEKLKRILPMSLS
jgi:hypothetical protein